MRQTKARPVKARQARAVKAPTAKARTMNTRDGEDDMRPGKRKARAKPEE